MPDFNDFDQTLFQEEEPLFERMSKGVTKKGGPKLVPIVLITLGVLVVSAIALAFLNRGPKQTVIEEATPTPTATAVPQPTYLKQLFYELEQDLKNADPSKNTLPFPPVEQELLITE